MLTKTEDYENNQLKVTKNEITSGLVNGIMPIVINNTYQHLHFDRIIIRNACLAAYWQ